MDNVFQSRKSTLFKEQTDQKNHNEERKKVFKETFNSVASSKFQNKLMTFVKEGESQTILDAFKTGSYPLINPALHSHRDRNKEKEKDEYGGIYLRHYQPAADRASQTQQDFLNTHLEGQIYNDHQPHLHPTISWLRLRNLKNEGPPLRYGLRIENESIVNNIDHKLEQIDHNPRDMKMVHDPVWKIKEKQKWVDSSKGFDNSTKASLKWSSNPPWPLIPVAPLDPYMGGFKQIEDKLGRTRDRKKEPKRNDFIGRVKDDPWGTTLNVSKSIRTLKGEQVMHGDTDRFVFSKNNKLDETSYKPSLIDTKSVDRIIPFNHSNNFQGLQLKNMGQNYPRIYKNSLIHYGLLEQQQNTVDQSGNYYTSFLYDGEKSKMSGKDFSSPPNKKLYSDDSKLLQKAHQMSTQSLEKSKRQATQQNQQDFRYNPPSDKQVSDAIGKYFKNK